MGFVKTLFCIGMYVFLIGPLLEEKQLCGQASPIPPLTPLPTALLPDAVVYKPFFHHVAAFGHKADELEARNEDSRGYREAFIHQLNINKDQADSLTQVAYQFEAKEKLIQAKVHERVLAFRARYSGGRLDPANPPPRPDPEMYALFLEKRDLVLEMRDQLRQTLGEVEFQRVNALIRTKIAPNIQPISPASVHENIVQSPSTNSGGK